MRTPPRIALALLTFVLSVAAAGCLNVYRRVVVTPVEPERAATTVQSPLKLHMLDGSVVLFPVSATFEADSVHGIGGRFGLVPVLNDRPYARLRVPIDSIAAAETFRTGLRPVETAVVTALATGAGSVGAAIALVAIFGSCPTVYSDVDGPGPVLEAESFSTSIVPLFELRDVDRLIARPDDSGRLTLEVRNEALETHYINHIELVEVAHPPDFTAVPGERGEALLLRALAGPDAARDLTGRDLTPLFASPDDAAYAAPDEVLQHADANALMDTLTLRFAAPETAEAGLYFRVRNSLLSTVFLYDFLLAGRGPGVFDWMNRELNSISGALKLADFYRTRMGIRVDVWDGAAYREIGRIREVGPIAWDDVALRVPVLEPDSVRVRLRLVADAWRIDRVALSDSVATVETRRLPFAELSHITGPLADSAAFALSQPDEQYHVTGPGDRLRVHFDTGTRATETSYTYFFAAQGYYTEWIRGPWLNAPDAPRPSEPNDETLAAAIARWFEVKDEFERRFESTKILTR